MPSHYKQFRNGAFILFLLASAMLPMASYASTPAPRPDSASGQQVAGMVQHIADSLGDKADYYWHQGDYPRIIAIDRIVVGADPKDMEAYSNAGWLLESDGDNPSAEAFYQMGCAANPGRSFISYQLGFFYFQTEHQYKKSIVVLSKSVHYADAADTDWKLLAHAYTRAGELDKALATWQEIKKLYPASPRVDANMQEVEAMIQKQQPSAATTP